MSFKVTVDVSDFHDFAKDFEKEMQEAVKEGLMDIAIEIADDAKTSHPYTDRTGNLTRSIKAKSTASGAVVLAEMEYASHVENMPAYTYLQTAAERVNAQEIINEAIEQAIRKSDK